jgi:predicted ATPase
MSTIAYDSIEYIILYDIAIWVRILRKDRGRELLGGNMQLKSVSLENWKNFRSMQAEIRDRLFVIGSNASGKSNFLDAFRFMRDIAKRDGGLQYAVLQHGGFSNIHCLSSRKEESYVRLKFKFGCDNGIEMKYLLTIVKKTPGNQDIFIQEEIIERDGKVILFRPNKEDREDEELLTQTHLEQTNTNRNFREIVSYFSEVQYMHLVPQLLKFPDDFLGPDLPEDPFGKSFLRTLAKTPINIRIKRLEKIKRILQEVVPQFDNLKYIEDIGQPHLEITHKHWKQEKSQNETQFSDGTLRFIGLIWSLISGQGLLLLEEPELSLHPDIVERLPVLINLIQRNKKRQIIITTHSQKILSNRGISLSEILLLQIDDEGTIAELACEKEQIKALFEGGLTPAEAVISKYSFPIIHL